MTVRTLSSSELGELTSLLDGYAFKPYRNYRVLPRHAQRAVLQAELRQVADTDGCVVCVDTHGQQACAVGRSLAWDSSFFAVPMGRIDYLMTTERTLSGPVLRAALDVLRERGVRHVTARVDVADIESMTVFEESGFRLVDSLVTYITRPRKEPPNQVREVGTIRDYRDSDADSLLAITAQAYAGYRSRFHLDPHLDQNRSDAFYLEWARQSMSGAMADMILVSEAADGSLLGYLAFRKREPVSGVGGVPVYGGGLGACRPDSPGAYAGLIRAGTLWAHERGAVAECQTQNHNFPVIRVYEAVGAHYVRAEYTLHLWLDRGT